MVVAQVAPATDSTKEGLTAKGVVRVFLTRNIGRRAFQTEEQYSTFQRWRGTPEFTKAIRSLRGEIQGSGLFQLDEESNRIKKIGYEMGVLSQYLLEYELMPQYEMCSEFTPKVRFHGKAQQALRELNIEESTITDTLNERLQREWSKWKRKKISLSRYGMYQIVLEQEFKNPVPLTKMLEQVLGLGQELDFGPILKPKIAALKEATEGQKWADASKQLEEINRITHNEAILKNSLDYSLQWEGVRELISQFLNSFGGNLTLKDERGREIPLKINEEVREAYTTGTSYNLRFRYVVFELQKLYRGNVAIPASSSAYTTETHDDNPTDLGHELDLKHELACLLEGVLLVDRETGRARLAPIRKDMIRRSLSHDVSSWSNEYCLFSADNSVICPHSPGTEGGIDDVILRASHPGSVAYEDYWSSVMRGVAYMTELRTVAKLLESDTSDDLEKITSYMPHVQPNKPDTVLHDEERIVRIATKVSNTSRLIARLRNATMPTTLATADYAVSKYKSLASVLELEKIIDHADSNVGLINNFLSHYDDMLLQSNSNQLQKDIVHLQAEVRKDSIFTLLLTIVLTVLTVVLAWLALPIFLNELSDAGNNATVLLNRYLGFLGFLRPTPAEWLSDFAVRCLIFLLLPATLVVGVAGYFIYDLWKHRAASLDLLARRFPRDTPKREGLGTKITKVARAVWSWLLRH